MKLTIRIDDKKYIEPIKDKDELLDKVVEYSAIFIPEDDQLIPDLLDLRDFDGVAYHIAECYGNKEPYTSNGKKYAELLNKLHNITYLYQSTPIINEIESMCKQHFDYYHLRLDLSNPTNPEERKQELYQILSTFCNHSSITYCNNKCIKLYSFTGKVFYVTNDRHISIVNTVIDNYIKDTDFPLIQEICDEEEFIFCESDKENNEYTYTIMKLKGDEI